jgi:hypothetical protein
MIQSAMMFALGFFVSGLLWLAFSVALVRRTRRITERRILAGVATRRAEFEAERDELRARHAVQMHRLEREVSRVLDLATAHRLEADIKERDLGSVKAELVARLEDLQDVEQSLIVHRDLVQDLERRNAEARAALRATQHALQVETRRRLAAEAAAVGMHIQPVPEIGDSELDDVALIPSVPEPEAIAPFRGQEASYAPANDADDTHGASIVPLRTRSPPPDTAAAIPAAATGRLAGEAHADFERNIWRAPAVGEARLPIATASKAKDRDHQPQGGSEDRVLEAVQEIRELKRTATQAGE